MWYNTFGCWCSKASNFGLSYDPVVCKEGHTRGYYGIEHTQLNDPDRDQSMTSTARGQDWTLKVIGSESKTEEV